MGGRAEVLESNAVLLGQLDGFLALDVIVEEKRKVREPDYFIIRQPAHR